MLDFPILSIIILLPLVSTLYITLFIGHSKSLNRQVYTMYVAILSSVLTLISTTYLLFMFDKGNPGFQFVEHHNWLQTIGLEFYVGIDATSLFLIFLTALLTLICIIASLFTIKKQIKEFLICLLLVESFCIGALCSLNLLLFYLFSEITLIPMFLIIGVCGERNSANSATKFFIYNFTGSLLFLVSLIYIHTKVNTFSITELTTLVGQFSLQAQKILWILLFITFAIRVPIIPFHTWVTSVHSEIKAFGSVILSGIFLILGGYSFIRILLPLLPNTSRMFAVYVLLMSAITIIYTSALALLQKDTKKIVTYASIANISFIIAGLFSFTQEITTNAIIQMIGNSLIFSTLFLIIGILYERYNTMEISEYGKSSIKMPMLSILFAITILSTIGFPGKFATLLGIFNLNSSISYIFALGLVLYAIYMLKLYKQTMFGDKVPSKGILKDLRYYEIITILPLVGLIIYFSVAHRTLLYMIPSIN